MKPEEIFIYRDIQRNTEMAIKAIDTLSDKVYEDDFALQISRQSLKYSDIRRRAMEKLLAARAEPVHANYMADFMLKCHSYQYPLKHQHQSSGRAYDTGQQSGDHGYM